MSDVTRRKRDRSTHDPPGSARQLSDPVSTGTLIQAAGRFAAMVLARTISSARIV